MYLLYLDDSGSAGNPNESHLVLGGFAVFERQVHWIVRELDKLAETIYPSQPNAIEFHASEIFSGRKQPWAGMEKPQRRDVIKAVLRIMADSHVTTNAFACVVHKASYPNQDPMEIAFEELCNRFDLLLKRLYVADDKQRGLIILDNSSYETSLQQLALDFRSLGTRWGVLRNLAEVPLFIDSRASRAVQLADHIAYAVFRRYEAGDASYFDIIAGRFDEHDNRVHGLVHKQTHDSRCMCLACSTRRS